MVWIILFIISTILAVYWYSKANKYNINREVGTSSKDPVFAIICTVIAIAMMTISAVQGVNGITDYPLLVKKLANAETLQARIKDIRDSHYKYGEEGALVAGSIENFKQSTILSDYITQLAAIEADYNSFFKECIAYKETFPLWFFCRGWAISDKVYDFKCIER